MHPDVSRFLALFTLLMVVVYSAIPYKAPWNLLGFLHGMILTAGIGAAWLLRRLRRPAARSAAIAFLAAAACHLGWQAWLAVSATMPIHAIHGFTPIRARMSSSSSGSWKAWPGRIRTDQR